MQPETKKSLWRNCSSSSTPWVKYSVSSLPISIVRLQISTILQAAYLQLSKECESLPLNGFCIQITCPIIGHPRQFWFVNAISFWANRHPPARKLWYVDHESQNGQTCVRMHELYFRITLPVATMRIAMNYPVVAFNPWVLALIGSQNYVYHCTCIWKSFFRVSVSTYLQSMRHRWLSPNICWL